MSGLIAALLAVALVGWAPAHGQGAKAPDGIVLLFVDDLHFAFRSTPGVRDLLIGRILPALMRDQQPVGIVTTGPSPTGVAPTSDRNIVLSRLRSITGSGLRPDDILDERGSKERRRRARVALATAKDTIEFLSASGIRRTLIVYVSDGYGESALTGELDEIAAAASRASATVYTVDSHGLVGPAPETDGVQLVAVGRVSRRRARRSAPARRRHWRALDLDPRRPGLRARADTVAHR